MVRIRNFFILLLPLAALVFIPMMTANAAQMRCLTQLCDEALISGPIIEGDYDRVAALMKENPVVSTFKLLSPGGSVSEGLKIGRLLRAHLIYTKSAQPVEDEYLLWGEANSMAEKTEPLCFGSLTKCMCASSCALIWLGGIIREGVIGLHRPFSDDPAFSDLSSKQAADVYNKWIRELRSYLAEMEVPNVYVEALLTTGSADVTWVEGDVLAEMPASIAEWLKAKCGDLTADEKAYWHAYDRQLSRLTAEARTKIDLGDAHKRRSKIRACRQDRTKEERLRLFPLMDFNALPTAPKDNR